MVEKGIRDGICLDKNKESSYLKYWGVNNLYGWRVPQQLSVDGFNLVENTFQFIEDFIENYNEDSDIFLKLMFNILKSTWSSPWLTISTWNNESKCVHIRNWKKSTNLWISIEKVHRIIKCNQEAWLKSYIDMNKNAKNDFKKDFFSKLMNNAVLRKTM